MSINTIPSKYPIIEPRTITITTNNKPYESTPITIDITQSGYKPIGFSNLKLNLQERPNMQSSGYTNIRESVILNNNNLTISLKNPQNYNLMHPYTILNTSTITIQYIKEI